MRQIKFRAWYKNEKLMLPIAEITFHKDGDILAFPLTREAISSYLVGGNVVLMQSTGLLDKDGKEIYEGDILGRNHLGEMQVEGVITYDKDLSRIVFNQVNGAFEEINKAELNLLEVIGNTYENQELINKQSAF